MNMPSGNEIYFALYVLQRSPEGRRGLFCPVSGGLGTNHSSANRHPAGGTTGKSADPPLCGF